LLVPDATDNIDRLRGIADRSVRGTERDRYYRWYVMTKALADYRTGEPASAVDWLTRKTGPQPGGVHGDASMFAVLAMAYHRLGQVEKAAAALANGKKILTTKMPNPGAGRPFQTGDWFDWLHADMFCREAEALLASELFDR
jgi:hypothetical protein